MSSPYIPVDQWGASFGQSPVSGGAQSPGGDGGLVLCGGLWDVSDRLHGWEDQTEYAPSTKVMTEHLMWEIC